MALWLFLPFNHPKNPQRPLSSWTLSASVTDKAKVGPGVFPLSLWQINWCQASNQRWHGWISFHLAHSKIITIINRGLLTSRNRKRLSVKAGRSQRRGSWLIITLYKSFQHLRRTAESSYLSGRLGVALMQCSDIVSPIGRHSPMMAATWG